jgi:hypothetical protein
MVRRVDAHSAPVWDVRVRGVKLVSVGGDGKVREWVFDPEVEVEALPATPLRTGDVTKMVLDELGNARAIEVGAGLLVANVPTREDEFELESSSVVVDIRCVAWISDDQLVIGTSTGEMYALLDRGRVAIVQVGRVDGQGTRATPSPLADLTRDGAATVRVTSGRL